MYWKGIYLVEFAIGQLNNWGQNCNVNVTDKRTPALILFNSNLGLHT